MSSYTSQNDWSFSSGRSKASSGRNSSDSRSTKSSSTLSGAYMVCMEPGQEASQRRLPGLQPLSIPGRDFGENPFTTDPRDGQPSIGGQEMIDIEGVAAGPFHQLNLASTHSSDDSEYSASQPSPRALTLSRSQSELRASPLRNYYANACRGRFSEGFSSVVSTGMVSPRPTSPSAGVMSTPPLSARMHSAPTDSDFGLPRRAKTMPRSFESFSDRTATRALSQRLQSQLERAQGEPLTPYLM